MVTSVLALGSIVFEIIGNPLILYVLTSVGFAFLFDKKMDEPLWKGFVPFYNDYTLFKKVYNPTMYFVKLGSFVVSLFTFGFLIVFLIAFIVNLVIHVLLAKNMAKSFGAGTGTFFALIFIPYFWRIYMAFNDDEYLGNAYLGEVAEDIVYDD